MTPRLPLVDPDDPGADPSAAALLQLVRGGLAAGDLPWTDVNVYRAMANHPDALSAVLSLGQAAYLGGTLTPEHRELAWLGASVANDCHYWTPTHVVLGRSAGLTEAKLAHIGDDPLPAGVYDDDELAVLEYTRRSSAMAPIDDELFGRLRAHLSERQVLDLCFTVGLANLVNRFHATFLTEVDPETQEVLRDACPLALPERPA